MKDKKKRNLLLQVVHGVEAKGDLLMEAEDNEEEEE